MLNRTDFETEVNGKTASLIMLENSAGMKVALTNYGARIVSVLVPDKDGHTVDVNLGAANIAEYLKSPDIYYGAVIGRVCGRIREAQFSIESHDFLLEKNLQGTFLHGGKNGFHTQVFEVVSTVPNKAVFKYDSPDQEAGFPGNLRLTVTYELTENNSLEISYDAVSDKKTPFNVTNHAYFNLNGEGSGEVLNHHLRVFSEQFLEIREDILPTGKMLPVQNTPFDFTSSTAIGKHISDKNQQIEFGNGFDHTFVLKETFDHRLLHAATAVGDKTGISLKVYTDQPGIHLYTGNFMDGSFTLKNAEKDNFRTAFCLETQHFADALTNKNFPTILLEPDVPFNSKTIFKFSVKQD